MARKMSLRRVLFVDSDAGLGATWTAAVEGHGFLAEIAPAGAALAKLACELYPVVVVDLAQRGSDGGLLIEELSAHHPATTFIATAQPAGLERAPDLKHAVTISTIVVAPFEPGELITALDDAFELSDRQRRHRATTFDRASVLLVEDNDGDAELVIDYLTEICGAVVTSLTRVEDAARALAFHRYDFVITDLTLPDARGLDAVRRLQPLAPDAAFIVLTGFDDEELALEAVKHGAQDYLVKGQIDAVSLRRALGHARERKQTWNWLRDQTRHDPLTGAGNRAALRERIETTLARARRRGATFAVMFIDLDRFKAINDSCGHDAGDIVLREVAERLRQAVRTTDVVARLGGDEFAVFLDDLWPDSRPLEVAERILHALAQPIAAGGRDLVVTASIGLACYPDVTGSVDELLKAADSAMYLAKGNGRNNVQVYGAVSDEERARCAVAAEVQHALERGEIALHFQPQYTVDRQRVVAFEALLRWTRSDGTSVPPTQLIPLLEDTGRIVAVGAWVLERACEQLARWRADGWPQLRVAVNLSARQLAEPGFVACVRAAMQRHAVPARCLELEITETVLMTDTSQTAAVLAELRALGVRIAIDDFGTGYSSLSYLSKFAVDCLKIDRSFIQDVDSDRERAVIASAIITLGHHLGLEVIAEGVETADQLGFLVAAKCDLVQGYLLGRPADASQFHRPIEAAQPEGARRTGRLPCVTAA
jgi:diguanylate cyclase (GGDEF)-like protein